MREKYNILIERQDEGRETYVLSVTEGHLTGKSVLTETTGKVVYTELDDADTEAITHFVETKDFIVPMVANIREDLKVFWDSSEKQKHVLILGAGHISKALEVLLYQIGYQCTVIDDRPHMAKPEKFLSNTTVLCGDYAPLLEGLNLNMYAGAIVVTRGHMFDKECLLPLLPTAIPYIGMLGSKRRVAVVKNILRREGIETVSERLYAPVGLDIGSETPEEIALSIVAEFISVLRHGTNRHLREV